MLPLCKPKIPSFFLLVNGQWALAKDLLSFQHKNYAAAFFGIFGYSLIFLLGRVLACSFLSGHVLNYVLHVIVHVGLDAFFRTCYSSLIMEHKQYVPILHYQPDSY
jgi:hypothetical protein